MSFIGINTEKLEVTSEIRKLMAMYNREIETDDTTEIVHSLLMENIELKKNKARIGDDGIITGTKEQIMSLIKKGISDSISENTAVQADKICPNKGILLNYKEKRLNPDALCLLLIDELLRQRIKNREILKYIDDQKRYSEFENISTRNERELRAIQLRSQGYHYGEISKQTGLTRNQLYYLFKKNK